MAYHPSCSRPDLTAADLVPLARVPGFSSDALYRRWYRCHVDLSAFLPQPAPAAFAAESGPGPIAGPAVPGIPHIPDASSLSAEEFEARFDSPGQPVLLGGLTADWPGGEAA